MNVTVGRVARDLAALEEQMDRALEQAFGAGLQLPRRGDTFRPPVDIYETSDSLVVRVELAGGWTDTPPYTLEYGGAVLNAAVDLNGQPPVQAYLRVIDDLVIRISYDDDLQRARDVLLKVLTTDTRVLDNPPPGVTVRELADTGVDLNVRPWVVYKVTD